MQHHQLSINVSNTLTLDAGWWEETIEETVSGNSLPCRLIHPPEPTMYHQVVRHLETISREAKVSCLPHDIKISSQTSHLLQLRP